ncbi:HYR domain-containing protein [Gillisia marina]|uniref:HYR domain-containing protein n=1 Tax=Gillisia marina TaxID=1167637 RepID=UPI00029AF478|nr:HYR domain-containing protein [Gillisia marina]
MASIAVLLVGESASYPNSLTANSSSGECGTIVNIPEPTGSDDCSGATVTLIDGIPSGSLFPVGTTTNIYEVTNGSGITTRISFDITVIDIEDPVIACPANITQDNDTGNCGAIVNYETPLGTDNCSGVTTVQTAGLASGELFPVGTTTNTFVTTDAAGKTATCSFDIIVKDTEAPQITCPASITQNNDPGICGAVVNYEIPTVTDNCNNNLGILTSGISTLQLESVSSASGIPSAISYNPGLVRYYSVNAGNQNFSISCYDGTTGAFISTTTAGFDYRGSWWNPFTNQSEGNGFSSGGIIVTNLDGDCPDGTVTSLLPANQPNRQSNGDFNYDTNEIVYYNSGRITRVDRTTGTTLGTITLSATPESTNYALYSIGYTGVERLEYALFDKSTDSVHLYNLEGEFQGTSSIGISSNDFNFSYENGLAWIYNGGKWNGFKILDFSISIVQTAGLPSGSEFPVGTTTNTFEATDSSGNKSACSFDVTVKDAEAPQITCPNSIVTDTDPGTCTARVTFSNPPIVVDNCVVETTQTAGLPSGSNFPVGENFVEFTTTDGTFTETCSFTITVEDKVLPEAIAQDLTIALDANGTATITAVEINNGSNDNCGIKSISVSPSSFTCADVGANTVTLTVIDNNDNISSTTSTVTVEDNIAPTAIAQDIILELDEDGNVSIQASDLDGGSTDNCSGGSLVLIAGSPYDEFLNYLDPSTYASVSPPISITVGGNPVNGLNGMDRSPINNEVYIVVKPSGGGRRLATLDPLTGVATIIGSNFSENFASITFDSVGNLFGVTGDGSSTSESLFSINPSTGAITYLTGLGAGSDGEAIAFNPDDGLIYHWSGRDSNFAFESIDPVTLVITSIPVSGYLTDEILGAQYLGNGEFILANLDQEFVTMTTTGFSTQLGDTAPNYYKGMEYAS